MKGTDFTIHIIIQVIIANIIKMTQIFDYLDMKCLQKPHPHQGKIENLLPSCVERSRMVINIGFPQGR
jgi:hypothetical protein